MEYELTEHLIDGQLKPIRSGLSDITIELQRIDGKLQVIEGSVDYLLQCIDVMTDVLERMDGSLKVTNERLTRIEKRS